MKQKLLWIPKGIDVGGTALKCEPIPYKDKAPTRVWTLLTGEDEKNPPKLPIHCVHHKNAFIEDRIHDWDISKGQFRYYSRASEGEVWLVLEFDE